MVSSRGLLCAIIDTMGFAILRVQKLKHRASIRRSLKHAHREQTTPNADPTLTPTNTHIGAQSTAEGMAALEDRLPAKHRKDAVLAIEYLVTGSPESIQGKSRAEQDAYFDDALSWLRDRHGAENVIYAGIHRDETTPHLYAYVVPLDPDSGRLNCKRYLGGKKALSTMQTEFAETVGKPHGLERGQERSKARHKTIRRYYAEINAAEKRADAVAITAAELEPRQLPKTGWRKQYETPSMVASRISRKVRPLVAKADNAHRQAERSQQQANAAAHDVARQQGLMAALRDSVAPYVSVFRDLFDSQRVALMRYAQSMRDDNATRRMVEEREQARADEAAEAAKPKPKPGPGM